MRDGETEYGRDQPDRTRGAPDLPQARPSRMTGSAAAAGSASVTGPATATATVPSEGVGVA
jgi:hypothetical protein